MKNPFLVTGVLSIAVWVTIREQAFEADPLLASFASASVLPVAETEIPRTLMIVRNPLRKG